MNSSSSSVFSSCPPGQQNFVRTSLDAIEAILIDLPEATQIEFLNKMRSDANNLRARFYNPITFLDASASFSSDSSEYTSEPE